MFGMAGCDRTIWKFVTNDDNTIKLNMDFSLIIIPQNDAFNNLYQNIR